jgi:hypothetical protein
VAREIGRRDGARAVVSGSISPLASGYLVTLRLIESETGNELASDTATAVSAEHELLPALSRAGMGLRRRIGRSSHDSTSAALVRRRPLTTTSLEAARLMWSRQPLPPPSERIALARASIRLDTAFAYAWMSVGNMLAWTQYRSSALDSAFTMAYRFRDNATLMERSNIGSLYWWNVQRDRRTAQAELEAGLRTDTTLFGAVALNLTELLNETQQFERSEAFGRRIEKWSTVRSAVSSALVRSQVAQGKYAAAESTVMRLRPPRTPNDLGMISLRTTIALGELRFDSAGALLKRIPMSNATSSISANLYRLRGRVSDAHRMDGWLDSSTAASAAAGGARFDPMPGRALTRAREALWLDHDRAVAVRHLDWQWRTKSQVHDIQDRIEGMNAAALYAAAGRPAMARNLLATFENGADAIARRSTYEHEQAALAEIALAEGRFTDAMRLFRASDLGADGLPARPCAVCVLPHLARVAERAGWSDSARVFWDGYVNRPAIDRLSTDQWFLPAAYGRLAAFASARGDSATAAKYRAQLARLRTPGAAAR